MCHHHQRLFTFAQSLIRDSINLISRCPECAKWIAQADCKQIHVVCFEFGKWYIRSLKQIRQAEMIRSRLFLSISGWRCMCNRAVRRTCFARFVIRSNRGITSLCKLSVSLPSLRRITNSLVIVRRTSTWGRKRVSCFRLSLLDSLRALSLSLGSLLPSYLLQHFCACCF